MDKKKKKNEQSAFSTYALADNDRPDKKQNDAGTTLPSEENVEDAKNWVDFNKK